MTRTKCSVRTQKERSVEPRGPEGAIVPTQPSDGPEKVERTPDSPWNTWNKAGEPKEAIKGTTGRGTERSFAKRNKGAGAGPLAPWETNRVYDELLDWSLGR